MAVDTASVMPNPGLEMRESSGAPALDRSLLTRVGDKWTILVIIGLVDGLAGFTRLQGRIPGISHGMLDFVLRVLTRDGLVERASVGDVVPPVEYCLTELGFTLVERVTGLARWLQDHQHEIKVNRATFDSVRSEGT